MCGWAFLISLTFCIQTPADGIAGTQQVGLRPAAALFTATTQAGCPLHTAQVAPALTRCPASASALTPPPLSALPPGVQIFMSVFQGRYGSYEGAAIFQAILFIASNFCGVLGNAPGGNQIGATPRPMLLRGEAGRTSWPSVSPTYRTLPEPVTHCHPSPAGIFCVTSNSRMLYAFARDRGIFGWRWWKEVSAGQSAAVGLGQNSLVACHATACLRLGCPSVRHASMLPLPPSSAAITVHSPQCCLADVPLAGERPHRHPHQLNHRHVPGFHHHRHHHAGLRRGLHRHLQ